MVDLLLPLLARLVRRVDVSYAVALTSLDHVRDPSTLHLDRGRSVREQSRTLRPVEVEHVWIPSDCRAQVGVRCLLPLVLQRFAFDVAETHGRHASCDHVKPGSDADDVEVVVRAIFHVDACFIEVDDGVVLGVDDVDVGAVELLEVGVLEARSFDAPVVRHVEWRKYVFLLRIVDTGSLLLGPEVVCLLVGLLVEQVILVVAKPESEAAIPPKLFVELLSFFGTVIERVLLREGIEEAAEAMLTKAKKFWIPLLGNLLLFNCEVPLAHWYCQVRSPLEDLEVACLWSPGLRQLNTRGTCADDRTLLAVN